jgi:hypothetical protein
MANALASRRMASALGRMERVGNAIRENAFLKDPLILPRRHSHAE